MPRLLPLALGLTVLAVLTATAGARIQKPSPHDEPGTIPASFPARSYRPGDAAVLVVRRPPAALTIRFFHEGPERLRPERDDILKGVPVGGTVQVKGARGERVRFHLRIGPWRSGLYYARLTAPGGRLGYAPFVLRSRRLGQSRVAVVLPTNTWQAYNFRDDNGDGVGDTWYADPHITSVDLTRPFLDRGVPPHFRSYDRSFIRWLAHTGRRADFLSDDDLERLSGRKLARHYDLVIFSGHEEYVTGHVYDAIERYRDLGGNLAFLSSNNFFYRVVRRGDRLYRLGRWIDVGRRSAPLLGVDYVGWNHNEFPNRPYRVADTAAAPWFFRGTGLRDGDRFGNYGIEIDRVDGRSPPGTRVLARVPNIFGRGQSAEMAYYTTPRGAKVFAAGVINFGGSAERPVVRVMLANLWRELARP